MRRVGRRQQFEADLVVTIKRYGSFRPQMLCERLTNLSKLADRMVSGRSSTSTKARLWPATAGADWISRSTRVWRGRMTSRSAVGSAIFDGEE